jgi:hypothetical protein
LSVVDALLFDLLLDLYEKDKRQISLWARHKGI